MPRYVSEPTLGDSAHSRVGGGGLDSLEADPSSKYQSARFTCAGESEHMLIHPAKPERDRGLGVGPSHVVVVVERRTNLS